MSIRTWAATAALFALVAAIFVSHSFHPAAIGQEGEEAEFIEKRLEEIERQIEEAEQADDEERLEELREEAEELFDELEAIERRREGEEEFEGDEFEREIREVELHRMHLEVEKISIELRTLRQESAMRMAELMSDPLRAKVYALETAVSRLEPHQAHDFLLDLLEQSENLQIKALVRQRLAEVSFEVEDSEEAMEHLRSLILSN